MVKEKKSWVFQVHWQLFGWGHIMKKKTKIPMKAKNIFFLQGGCSNALLKL